MTTVDSLSSIIPKIVAAQHAPYIVVDVETNGDKHDIRCDPKSKSIGVSIAYPGLPEGGIYLPFRHKHGNVPDTVRDILRDVLEKADRLVYFNAKHDIVALGLLDIDVWDVPFYDAMLMQHWIDENNIFEYSLDWISRYHGGLPKQKSEAFNAIVKQFGYEYVPPVIMDEYASGDAFITMELFEKLYPEFKKQGFDDGLWDSYQPYVKSIIRMESPGIAIDRELIEKEIIEGEIRQREIVNWLQCNPGSPKDLEFLLIGQLGLPIVKRTKKGKISFDKRAMERYEELLAARNDETAKLILEYRGWTKTLSSNYRAYFDLLSIDGYLRPNYKLHGTVTRRLSCEKPNLQQIPRRSENRWNGNLKKAFIPRIGYGLWDFDYKNLELRLGALYAGEQALLDAFWNGEDVFESIAYKTSWSRQGSKTFVYATSYGGGDNRISNLFGITKEEAKRMRAAFFNLYPHLREATEKAASLCKRRGYVKLWTGMRRHFVHRNDEAHKAFNSVIQGGAAEIVRYAITKLDTKIDWNECKLLLQVHDSVVAEIKEGTEAKWIPIIKDTMENVQSFHSAFAGCPFPVDVKKWGE